MEEYFRESITDVHQYHTITINCGGDDTSYLSGTSFANHILQLEPDGSNAKEIF